VYAKVLKASVHIQTRKMLLFYSIRIYFAFFKDDGDSSVTEKLRRAKPYGVDSPIEKAECTNHICRNFNKRLSELSKDRTCPLEMRKLLSKTLDRMRIGVYSAIKKTFQRVYIYRVILNDCSRSRREK
jgi:hypothetical protein